MQLLEFNLIDLYDLSNEEIEQGDGLNSTINRFETEDYIRHAKVEYKPNSYFNKGVFEFIVKYRRGINYAAGKKIRDAKRRNQLSEHTVRIRPKFELNSLEELENVEIDLHCTCNDFLYVFMDMAYNGYKQMAGKIAKYGMVPSTGGVGKAHVRNPNNRGALCKHSLLVVERIMYDQDPSLLNKMASDIKDRFGKESFQVRTAPGEDDLIQFDDKFYDENGRPKHRSKIAIARKKKIQQIINLIRETEHIGLRDFRGSFEDGYSDFRESIMQMLLDFDSYYIGKADSENKAVTKYLPNDYEDAYDELNYQLDRAKDIIEYSNDLTDDSVNYAINNMSDDEIDKANDLLDFDFDKLLKTDPNDLDNLLGESFVHISNFKNFKHVRQKTTE
jgi:hypothetical protein